MIHNTVRTVFITLESYHRNDHLNLMHCVAVSIVFNKISTFFFFAGIPCMFLALTYLSQNYYSDIKNLFVKP